MSDGSVPLSQQQLFKPIGVFIGEYEPLSYVVEPIIRSGCLYTITGRTGHGKTGWLTAAAFAVATGRPDILGLPVEAGIVAYIAIENPDDVRMRMAATAFRHNVPCDKLPITVCARRIGPDLARLKLENIDRPIRLIIVDSFQAAFDGDNFNDNVQVGDFTRRLRELTTLPGRPAVIVAAHPVKNASADQLIPYGGGATLNELDGNLTAWRDGGLVTLHWQGKFRGPEFEPRHYRFEQIGSPDLLDAKGRQVPIPVCIPTTEAAFEERTAVAAGNRLSLLRAIKENPTGSQRDWVAACGLSKGATYRALKELRSRKCIEQGVDDRWRLTQKGEAEAA